MAADRASFRDIHFSNASTGASLGGLYQAGSITEENLIWILSNVLLIVEHSLLSSTEPKAELLHLETTLFCLGIMISTPLVCFFSWEIHHG